MIKLVSCGNCGAVLDESKLHFNDNIYTEDGIDERFGTYVRGLGYVPYVTCPVCGEPVTRGESWDISSPRWTVPTAAIIGS